MVMPTEAIGLERKYLFGPVGNAGKTVARSSMEVVLDPTPNLIKRLRVDAVLKFTS